MRGELGGLPSTYVLVDFPNSGYECKWAVEDLIEKAENRKKEYVSVQNFSSSYTCASYPQGRNSFVSHDYAGVIDQIWVSEGLLIESSGVGIIDERISDHAPVFAQLCAGACLFSLPEGSLGRGSSDTLYWQKIEDRIITAPVNDLAKVVRWMESAGVLTKGKADIVAKKCNNLSNAGTGNHTQAYKDKCKKVGHREHTDMVACDELLVPMIYYRRPCTQVRKDKVARAIKVRLLEDLRRYRKHFQEHTDMVACGELLVPMIYYKRRCTQVGSYVSNLLL